MGLYVIVIDVIFRNPYGFYRRWQIPGDGEANFVDQIQSKYLEKEFNSHVQKLKKQIEEQSNSYKAQMELLEKTQKEQIEEQKKQHQHLLRLLGARSESNETAETGNNSVDPPLTNSSALVDPPLNSLTKINEKVKGNSKRVNKGKSIVEKKNRKKIRMEKEPLRKSIQTTLLLPMKKTQVKLKEANRTILNQKVIQKVKMEPNTFPPNQMYQ
jgi:hypothetical protein